MFSKSPSRQPPAAAPAGLTRDHVIWAYRLLLDREPEDEGVIGPKLAGSRDTAELRRHLMTSAEFRDKNPDYARSNDPTLVIKEIAPGVRLIVDLADHVIGLGIVRGRYEPEAVAFVRSQLAPGEVAIDVGAHIGFFTMHMADCVGAAGHVYAFEPVEANARLLALSLAENAFAERVTLQQAAAGQADGSATLTFPRETLNTGGAYLLREGERPLAGGLVRTVPIVALDETARIGRVALMKMDVEGAEPQVVHGARRILTVDRPVVLSELHPAQLQRASGSSGDDFLDQMAALGYRAHVLADGAPGPVIERVVGDEILSVVFLPRT